MKTFLLEIIPKIQRYSQKLDNITILTNKHWVVIDEDLNKKVVFIFREKENQLLISENGKIEKGSWEYLGNNSLLIDRKDGSYLFKHGFIDDTVLALKVDGKEEYALLVNEHKFDTKINSLDAIIRFLSITYNDEKKRNILTLPEDKGELTRINRNFDSDKFYDDFVPTDYPELISDMEVIRKTIQKTGNNFASEILISFCRNHSIKAELVNQNRDFTNKVVSGQVPIEQIEHLFKLNRNNKTFIEELQKYLQKSLK